MKITEAILHYMVKAEKKTEGITTGASKESDGVKMPAGMRAAVQGIPGQTWRTLCGSPLVDTEKDGMTLSTKMVSCEGCKALPAFAKAVEDGY